MAFNHEMLSLVAKKQIIILVKSKQAGNSPKIFPDQGLLPYRQRS
jgi:hypothetical protein